MASTRQIGSKRRKIKDEGDQDNGQEKSDQVWLKYI